MDKESLYNRIDDMEELSDSEKRDEYFAEIDSQEQEEQFNQNHGY